MANETFNGKVLQAISLKADKDFMNVDTELLVPKVEACLFDLERTAAEYRFVHFTNKPNLAMYAPGSIVFDSYTGNLYLIKQNGNQVINYNSTVAPTITESGTTSAGYWYRKWSNGDLEQGGVYTGTSSFGTATITMPKSFSNTNYILTVNTIFSDTTVFTNAAYVGTPEYIADLSGVVVTKTVNTFKCSTFSSKSWYARGTAAS